MNDYASMLSLEDRAKIEGRLRQYEAQTSIDLTVVTVPSLNGMPIEDYSVELFKQWGIGKKGKDNGVLLLFAPSERKVRIEAGYGIEPYLTDGAAGDIIRNKIVPAYRAGKIADSVSGGVEGIIAHLGDKPYGDRASRKQDQDDNAVFVAIIVLGTLVVGVVIILFFGFRKKESKTEEEEGDCRLCPTMTFPSPTQERGSSRRSPRVHLEREKESERHIGASPSDEETTRSSAWVNSDPDPTPDTTSSQPEPESQPEPFEFGGGASGGAGATGDL